MIKISSLSLLRGHKTLLTDSDLTIFPGQKWGVIGSNGCGKSSFFKLLLGEVSSDTGTVSIPNDWEVSHMAQEIEHTEATALDYVLSGDVPLCEIEKAIEDNVEDGEKLAHLYAELEQIDGYSARARAQKLLSGLGFVAGAEARSVKEFSGGWRIRLNLARALMCRSDLLLLDEPTNHLDMDATLWLEAWLQSYPGTLVIISHDRDFLDNVVTHIVNFEAQKLWSYTGGYSSFERQRAERLAQQQSAFVKQQERVQEIEDFVRRFKAKASKAKQAQSRIKELERMETIAPAHVDSPFHFKFPVPDKLPQQLINLTQAGLGYSDKEIVSNVELSILGQHRIGLLGHNGAGKTTLIKTLAGTLSLASGERVESANLKIGYFAQHQLEALDPEASCVLHLQRLSPNATEQELRNFVGGFGFHGDRALEAIGHFSGGEKARLALAILAWQKPNLLLLDEPTNHLDLEMRHALTVALQGFEGAIVVVSHDRHLLRNTVEEFLLVDDGKVQEFDGDLEDYHRWLQQANKRSAGSGGAQESALTEAPQATKQTPPKPVDKKESRQAAAAAREALKPLTSKLKKTERELESKQQALAKTETALADESLYAGDNTELTKLLKEQGDLKKQIENLEAEWLDLTDQLENLNAL